MMGAGRHFGVVGFVGGPDSGPSYLANEGNMRPRLGSGHTYQRVFVGGQGQCEREA